MFSKISTEAKVGLFVLGALILLAYMSFQVGEYGFGFRKGYLVNATFDNVSGLKKDASVQIAGVEVGRVEEIALKNGKAVVTLRVKPEVKIEKDAAISIKTHGVLGDKYVDIVPGLNKKAYVEEGEQIMRVERQADIDRLLVELTAIADDVKQVTASLRNVMGNETGEANLRAILTNTRELAENLNAVVKQNDQKFSTMLDGFTKASKNMEKTFASLSHITEKINKGEGTIGQLVNSEGVFDNLNQTLSALKDITEKINSGDGTIGQLVNNDKAFDNLNQTLASLQEITYKINTGQGTLGKLVNDDATVDNLNIAMKSLGDSMEGINNYLEKGDQFRTFLSYRGEYLFDSSNTKSYINLKIQPKEDKFYLLGLVDDPRGKRSITDTTVNGVTTRTEEWDRDDLLFNVMIGKRYRDLVVRGGIIESTGGVGIDYFAFDDNLQLSFEAFDFDEDRDPHLKIFGEYRLMKHIYLSAGWDDFLSDEGNDSPFVGFSIRFEDDDLKYLLSGGGAASLAK